MGVAGVWGSGLDYRCRVGGGVQLRSYMQGVGVWIRSWWQDVGIRLRSWG